jgi:hypothetical protein
LHCNSPPLAFSNDVLDEPASASRKDGIGNFAKKLHFGRRPVGCATDLLLLRRQFRLIIPGTTRLSSGDSGG